MGPADHWESVYALRAVRQFLWLEVGSSKMALSAPHPLAANAHCWVAIHRLNKVKVIIFT